jgi:hypothetical protein
MVPDPSADAELERFQLFVNSHLAPLPVTTPLPDSFGPWVSIVSAAAKATLALGSVRGGEAVVDLLLAVIDIGGGKGDLLASIKQDTTLLRQEPLKTAMTYMAEARRVGPGDERFKRFIDTGIHSLYQANSLADCLEEQAYVQYCIACSYLAVNARSDALHWFSKSMELERDVLDVLLKKRLGVGIGFQGRGQVIDCRSDRPAVGGDRRRKGLNATLNASYGLAKGYVDLLTLGTTMAAQAAIDLRIRRRRLEALEQFLHFVNTVEVSADEASGRTASMILRLEAGKAPIYKGGGIRISGQYGERWYLKEVPFDCARLTEGAGGSPGPGLRRWW